MPNYLTPGVYVEEVPSLSKPIEGVGTSNAAFVGLAPAGPVNTVVQCSNWGQFARAFSDPDADDPTPFMEGAYLAHAVYGFFHNGGSMCYVVRVGADSAAGAPQAGLPVRDKDGVEAFRAVAREGAENVTIELIDEAAPAAADDAAKPAAEANTPADDAKKPAGGAKKPADDVKEAAAAAKDATNEAGTPSEDDEAGKGAPLTASPLPSYKLVVTAKDAEREEHTGLSLQKGGGYIVTKVNQASKLIQLEESTANLPALQRTPKAGRYELVVATDGDARELTGDEIVGDPDRRTGMGGLAAIDEVTMLCVPDIMTLAGSDVTVRDLQGKMIQHCESLHDRMAILDAPPEMGPLDLKQWRSDVGYTSKFATLYYPWIEVMDPLTKRPIQVPPCGHIAGVWARTDASRGVHKAPANEVVLGATGLAFQVTQGEQGDLNRTGVNCIRQFPGRGIRIWGARTLSSVEDPEWKYLNVRRLFNFVSESILEGTQWAVFEPNDERLWTQLRIASSNFLTGVWRDGALFGATPGEAFYVKCDAETNPPDQVANGEVTVEIGIAPVKPAEFIVFRISQFQAGEAA